MTRDRIWVTGGAGFLGTAIVGRLVADGESVRCLVRNRLAAERLREAVGDSGGRTLEILLGSLNDTNDCRSLVAGCDRGIHAAAAGSGATASLFANNVVATRNLLDAIRGSDCRRMVLVSSLAVLGTNHLRRGQVVDETCPLDPYPDRRDPYTFSKIAEERLCAQARVDWRLPLVIVRPGVIYGPGRDPVTSRVGLRVGPVLVQMGGRHPLPYTYVDNCATAIASALVAPSCEGEAFNIVDDELPSGNRIVCEARRYGARFRVLKIPSVAVQPLSRVYHWYSRRSLGQVPPVLTAYRSAASWKPLKYTNTKARIGLSWQPGVGLADGLRRAAADQSSRSR